MSSMYFTEEHNSFRESFKAVTKISDSLLQAICPYFKFPDWVVAKRQKERLLQMEEVQHQKELQLLKTNKKHITADINQVSANGIADKAGISLLDATKIVSYREAIKGYTYMQQLNEVPNVGSNVLRNTIEVFSIKEKPLIDKINVN